MDRLSLATKEETFKNQKMTLELKIIFKSIIFLDITTFQFGKNETITDNVS